MRIRTEDLLKETGILVIDGSMSTALENMGISLNDRLWTARVLMNDPDRIQQVHINYFRAGADSGITCSYQASIPGFCGEGCSEKAAEKYIADAVRIFLRAREIWWEEEGKNAGRAYPICLAGIGPYGAALADGSEYRGDYDLSPEKLRAFHRKRAEILWEAGADVLLFETQPSLREALVEAEIAEEIGADYWISFSCMDGCRINEGTMLSACAKALSPEKYPHLRMIGVNCTDPRYIVSLIGELKKSTSLPIAVYPNSGEVYDPESKTWSKKIRELSFGSYALKYMQAGASAVGGCCTTVERHIRDVAKAREAYLKEI